MALFGSAKDILTFTGMAREVMENIVSQAIGYYKYKVDQVDVNVYGEGMNKYFIGPVLLNCLIDRGDFEPVKDDFGVNVERKNTFRFLKYHLIQANIFPEPGDIIMYNEDYYHVDNVNENQLIVGKDPDYSYENGLNNFGTSFSILLETHLSSQEPLGITKNRL